MKDGPMCTLGTFWPKSLNQPGSKTRGFKTQTPHFPFTSALNLLHGRRGGNQTSKGLNGFFVTSMFTCAIEHASANTDVQHNMSGICSYFKRVYIYKKGKEDHRFLGGKRKPVRMQSVVDIRTVGIKFTRGSLCTRSSVRTATQSRLGGYGYGANVRGPPNAYVEA